MTLPISRLRSLPISSQAPHRIRARPARMTLAGLCIALAACSAEEPDIERPPRPVHVVEATRQSPAAERRISGRVRAPGHSQLSFRVPGLVTSRPVELGTRLRAGQLVAELDATDFRLRAGRSEAALESFRAEAREAEAEFRRVRALYAGDHVPRGTLDRALARVERARAAVAEGERNLEIARRELEYTRLRAPVAGVVIDLLADAGQNLSPGQAVIGFAEADDLLEVEWPMPEGLIGRLRVGDEVEIALPALGDGRLPAEVVEVGASPRSGGTTFPVVARLLEVDSRLRAGMAAEVFLRLAEPSATESAPVLLPPHAVAGDPNGRYLFVVEEAGGPAGDAGETRTIRRQEVTVGRLLPSGLEILTGLDGGETVVAAGATLLDDGQVVRLLRGDPLAELPSTRIDAGDGR